MNELIKFKKHKYYKISNTMKNDLVISEIMYEIIDNIILDIEEKECRICFEEETADNPFIWPCRCKGTSKYVHRNCLETWRNENVDRDAFEMCMECRYSYKFINKYPYEFGAIIPINFIIILFFSFIIPILVTYPIASINKANDNIIIKFYSRHNSSFFRYMNYSNMYYDTINYDICYNIVVFNQTLLFIILYNLFVFLNVHRKYEYYKRLKPYILLHFIYIFKFILILNIVDTSSTWLTFFLMFSFAFGIMEPFYYMFIIKQHNNILYSLDLHNKFILQNYESEDENEIVRTLSDSL